MTGTPLFLVAAIACLAVLGILMFGIASFARGGAFNKKYSNKIMQLRIVLQAVAVVLILLVVAFGGRGN